jgi:predicted cupin superfamily sugar epimerase
MKNFKKLLVLATSTCVLSCSTQTPQDKNMNHPTAEQVAQALNLSGHIEGGYYRRTYQADHRKLIPTSGGDRYLMTSIYYMLTKQSPIGHFHKNKSDIMHYYHLGDPVRYTLIYPDGKLETVIMGGDVTHGQVLQLMVKGGIWKASELLNSDYGYGLISEAVSPGFDFADMTLGDKEKLTNEFPQHRDAIGRLSK